MFPFCLGVSELSKLVKSPSTIGYIRLNELTTSHTSEPTWNGCVVALDSAVQKQAKNVTERLNQKSRVSGTDCRISWRTVLRVELSTMVAGMSKTLHAVLTGLPEPNSR